MTRYRLPVGGLRHPGAARTALRLIGSRLPPARRSASVRTHALGERTRAVIASTGHSATCHPLTVRARRGWLDTGVSLRRGETVTLLAQGTLGAARALDMSLTPTVGLWFRVGDGPALSMHGRAMVLCTDTDGALHVLAAEPGILVETGTLDRHVSRLPLTGAYSVVIIRWQQHAHAALAAAAITDPDLFAPALIRARTRSRPPAGWTYHPRLGTADIFTDQHTDAHAEISCVTAGDVGILRYPVDVTLTEDLVMSWSWRVEALPSRIAENIEPTHDYLSVAVEFDDGRDMSWMWSSELAPGTVFGCPLAYWRDRETHLVIRSGTQQLGQWITEHRSITADLRAALSAPHPRRVVAMWLIANSTFQGGLGACRYRDLRLHTTDTTLALSAGFPGSAAQSTTKDVS